MNVPLEHSNVLKFIAASKVAKKRKKAQGYLIMFEFPPMGTLRNYLQYCHLSLKGFLRLSTSATHSLKYLHDSGDGKWPIAHRDLGSHCFYVRLDGTCVLGNLDHAIQFKTVEDELGDKLYVSIE